MWANSRRYWRTEELGMLQSMGLQRVGHDLATEKQDWVIRNRLGRSKMSTYQQFHMVFCNIVLKMQVSISSFDPLYILKWLTERIKWYGESKSTGTLDTLLGRYCLIFYSLRCGVYVGRVSVNIVELLVRTMRFQGTANNNQGPQTCLTFFNYSF